MKETELATRVVKMLHEWHWDVYQEVVVPGGRIDIVGVRGPTTWGIECKTTMGLAVIGQAYQHIRHCNYVSIAVGYKKLNPFARTICAQLGIGILGINTHRDDAVMELQRASLHRKVGKLRLRVEQRTWCAAGSQHGEFWTPFRSTKRALISYVRNHPGCHFDQVLREIDMHYGCLSTAKRCLRGFIGGPVIPEIEAKMVGGKLCLFLAGDANQ